MDDLFEESSGQNPLEENVSLAAPLAVRMRPRCLARKAGCRQEHGYSQEHERKGRKRSKKHGYQERSCSEERCGQFD